jgi:hypothetical protein
LVGRGSRKAYSFIRETRIGAERFIGKIHFSARKGAMTDDVGHIDEVIVNAVTCAHDMSKGSPFVASAERRDGQSDSKKTGRNQLLRICAQTKS